MIEFIINNKEWIFSGVGVSVVAWILFGKNKSEGMTLKSGKNSKNIQLKGNLTINNTGTDDE